MANNYPPPWIMADDDEDDDTDEIEVGEAAWRPDPSILNLDDALSFLHDAGMTVLSADKASDIDHWPSLASMLGMEDSAGDSK